MKKVVCLVLSVFILLGILTGCGGGGSNNATSTAADTKAETKATESAKPAKIVMTHIGTPSPDLKIVQDEINKLTIPKINVEVEIQCIETANYAQQVNLMITGNEKLDLMMTYPAAAAHFSTMVAQNQLKDLTELAEKYGKGIIEAINNVNPGFLDGTRVAGKLYGFTCLFDKVSGTYVSFRKDVMDKNGLDLTKVKNFKDFETILETLKKNESISPWYGSWIGLPVFVNPDDFSQNILYDSLGDGNYKYGVVMGTDNTKVVNLFATDYYRRMCEIAYDWYKKGYVYKDAATTTEMTYALVGNNATLGIVNSGETEHPLTIDARTKYPMVNYNIGNQIVTSSAMQKFTWTIPVSAKEPEAAMKFMNLMYTDAEIVNLLNYGIKDKHYVENSDGTISLPQGVVAGKNTYSVMGTFIFGNSYLAKVWAPGSPNLRKDTIEVNKAAKVSPLMGISIDNSSFKNELTAVTAVCDQYRKSLENGVTDPAKAVPEFVKALEAAGMNKIIAEVQKQVDAFVAAKK